MIIKCTVLNNGNTNIHYRPTEYNYIIYVLDTNKLTSKKEPLDAVSSWNHSSHDKAHPAIKHANKSSLFIHASAPMRINCNNECITERFFTTNSFLKF